MTPAKIYGVIKNLSTSKWQKDLSKKWLSTFLPFNIAINPLMCDGIFHLTPLHTPTSSMPLPFNGFIGEKNCHGDKSGRRNASNFIHNSINWHNTCHIWDRVTLHVRVEWLLKQKKGNRLSLNAISLSHKLTQSFPLKTHSTISLDDFKKFSRQ